MITEINEWRTLTKHTSYECKCKFDAIKFNSIKRNNKCGWKNGKYLGSIIDDSVIMSDEIIEETKAVPGDFNEKQKTVKQKSSIFYSPFYQLPFYYQ